MGSRWVWILVSLAWSTAAFADDIDECSNSVDHTRAIKGCTALISQGSLTGRNAVRAYYNRAKAHKEKGEYDLAISDYTKVIELDPNSTLGYIGRAEGYESKGNYDEAIADYTKAIAVDPNPAWTLNRRGEAHKKNGNYDAAIYDYTKSMEVDPTFCCIEDQRADAYLQKGDYDAAVADYTKSIERSPGNAETYNGRAWAHLKAGKAAQGLPDANRALELSPNTPGFLDTRGHIFEALGRREVAIADFRRALSIDPSIQKSSDALKRLGAALDEIEALHERIIVLDQAHKAVEAIAAAQEYAQAVVTRYGTDSIEHAFALSLLADLHVSSKHYEEAESNARQALALREKLQVYDRLEIAKSLTNLAAVLQWRAKYDESESLARRALAIRESALRPDHPRVAEALNNLAVVLYGQGRYAEAEAFERRAISILEKDPDALGIPGERLLAALNSMAAILERLNRNADAAAIYRRALEVADPVEQSREKELGAPASATHTSKLGKGSYFLSCGQNWPQVLVMVRRQSEDNPDQPKDRDSISFAQRQSDLNDPLLRTRVRATYRFGALDPQFQNESFVASQRMLLNGAARAVSQLATRFGSGQGVLADLVREQQDLLGRRATAYYLLRDNYQFGQISRIEESEETLRRTLADLDKSLDMIEARLKAEYPDYGALAIPEPLSIADVQAQLSAGEALLLFLDMDAWHTILAEETLIWVVTKTETRWVRSDLGTGALTEGVAALRCGLDSTNWVDASRWSEATEVAKRRKEAQVIRRSRCKQLVGVEVSDTTPPPFDLAKAHELYQALFGQVEDLIKDKHLLIAPSGPLAQLPFQVLVTDKPIRTIAKQADDYVKTPWLIRRHAITVLPSVASLKALRRDAKPSQATRPYIGFGNPLLDGDPARLPKLSDRRALEKRVASSRAKQACPKADTPREPVRIVGLAVPEALASLFRGGLGDVAVLRRQAPLPETADELCAIARETGAPEGDIYLGARTTETAIKELNAKGALGTARVVHFATHGLVAGETERVADSLAEPALMLTPPAAPSKDDDGLLTASEVAQLKLDADWVVLSACNTASGGEKSDAEALSGLARAFFYAGARALLVSHWYVDSRAAVQITTSAFAELKREPTIGRAEALRRAMLVAMNDAGRPKTWTPAAHPAVWAPFVLVGEGGATNTVASSAVMDRGPTASAVAAPGPNETGSIRATDVEPEQPKPKKKTSRRRKPAGEWDWLYEMWGQ